MKNFKIYISIVALTGLFISCGSTNCGCGLTGDANKVELNTTVLEQQTLVSEIE
ncbi:hypothetical protein R3X25_08860 [Lutibacter sp. TH_r2]|uniref:hypothetical protein n=1 Tax=Lutibacter sp. TH_r2 TaxID=3082083 RepID=UPI002954B6FE|nr:hypothetical protein [Lutibacter sp. TH_r2]MDV7187388.1 hypothetical protein [Lutibacter sp. TH_r2]